MYIPLYLMYIQLYYFHIYYRIESHERIQKITTTYPGFLSFMSSTVSTQYITWVYTFSCRTTSQTVQLQVHIYNTKIDEVIIINIAHNII